MNGSRNSCALAALGLAAGLAAAAVSAQEVELRSTDDMLRLSGTIEDFDGERYLLRTALGTLAVPAERVTCTGEGCPPPAAIRSDFAVASAGPMLALTLPELIDAYSLSIDTDISRAVTPEGDVVYSLLDYDGGPVADITIAGGAMADALAGGAALAVLPRPLSETEAAALGPGLDRAALARLGMEHAIGVTGLVVAAGSGVTRESISRGDLARLFAGEIANWSELGGPDAPVSAFTREPGSDARAMLERLVMEPEGMSIDANVIAIDTDQGVMGAVSAFPGSVAVIGWTGRYAARALAVEDACGTAIAADPHALKSGRYPLSDLIRAYAAPGALSLHGRGLLDFLQSRPGQQVLEQTGQLSLLPVEGAMEDPLAGEGAARLSVTLRPGPRGETLSPRARQALAALAEHVASGRTGDREILFIGRAAADNGEDRALDAAQAVLGAFSALSPQTPARAVGGVSETADCGTGGPGPVVEVWLGPGNGR